MAFTRQNVVTTSTFTTGGATETSSVPTFTQWENTSTTSGFEWKLGNKWTLNVKDEELEEREDALKKKVKKEKKKEADLPMIEQNKKLQEK